MLGTSLFGFVGFVASMAACCTFLFHFNDEHHKVNLTIASLTPMLSWLKGAPPGTYSSSHQPKNRPPIYCCLWDGVACFSVTVLPSLNYPRFDARQSLRTRTTLAEKNLCLADKGDRLEHTPAASKKQKISAAHSRLETFERSNLVITFDATSLALLFAGKGALRAGTFHHVSLFFLRSKLFCSFCFSVFGFCLCCVLLFSGVCFLLCTFFEDRRFFNTVPFMETLTSHDERSVRSKKTQVSTLLHVYHQCSQHYQW